MRQHTFKSDLIGQKTFMRINFIALPKYALPNAAHPLRLFNLTVMWL